jgi:hypothetical protein
MRKLRGVAMKRLFGVFAVFALSLLGLAAAGGPAQAQSPAPTVRSLSSGGTRRSATHRPTPSTRPVRISVCCIRALARSLAGRPTGARSPNPEAPPFTTLMGRYTPRCRTLSRGSIPTRSSAATCGRPMAPASPARWSMTSMDVTASTPSTSPTRATSFESRPRRWTTFQPTTRPAAAASRSSATTRPGRPLPAMPSSWSAPMEPGCAGLPPGGTHPLGPAGLRTAGGSPSARKGGSLSSTQTAAGSGRSPSTQVTAATSPASQSGHPTGTRSRSPCFSRKRGARHLHDECGRHGPHPGHRLADL